MPMDPPTESEARAKEKKDATMALYERVELPAVSGDPPVRVIWFGDRSLPANKADLIVFVVHGGGFNLFHSGLYLPWFAHVHSELEKRGRKVKFCSVDYALAPEKVFPYQLQQLKRAYAGYLLEELGVDPAKVVFSGDSAGGNLVFAFPLFLQQENLPLPSKIISISPWINLDHSAPSMTNPDNWMDQLDKPTLDTVGTHYLLGDVDVGSLTAEQQAKLSELVRNPLVSPVHATQEQLAALPPSYITIGDHEVLYDDTTSLFQKLEEVAPGKHRLFVGLNKVHIWIIQRIGEPDEQEGTVGRELIEFLAGGV